MAQTCRCEAAPGYALRGRPLQKSTERLHGLCCCVRLLSEQPRLRCNTKASIWASYDVQEADMYALGMPFGRVVAVLMLKGKTQGFIEMEDIPSASNLVSCYQAAPPVIRYATCIFFHSKPRGMVVTPPPHPAFPKSIAQQAARLRSVLAAPEAQQRDACPGGDRNRSHAVPTQRTSFACLYAGGSLW